jgi:hypothetical protein
MYGFTCGSLFDADKGKKRKYSWKEFSLLVCIGGCLCCPCMREEREEFDANTGKQGGNNDGLGGKEKSKSSKKKKPLILGNCTRYHNGRSEHAGTGENDVRGDRATAGRGLGVPLHNQPGETARGRATGSPRMDGGD